MSLTQPRKVYVYDGSFEGFLTGVFLAWRETSDTFGNMCSQENSAPGFTDQNITVITDFTKANRVKNWMSTKLPTGTEERVYEFFLSEDESRERILFFYLKSCNRLGRWVDSYLADPFVADFINREKRFQGELHRMYGFTRFQLLEENVLFSEIATDYNQLAGLGHFFLERMPGQRFLIYDSKRGKAVLSNGRALAMMENFHVDSIHTKSGSSHFEGLWQNYLEALTIEERKNYKLQRQLLPWKYRKYMTEFLKQQ